MAAGRCTADIGTAESKIGMEMVAQRNETESNGETACDGTEKPEGLSEMPERGNHPIKYFQANPYSLLQKLGWMRK